MGFPGEASPGRTGHEEDAAWMDEALAEARLALEEGEIPVGAVAVDHGRIVGRGRNRRKLQEAPFAHAEMEALRDACASLGAWRLDGVTLYVTLEPCPMCAGAILQTRVGCLVFGARDPRAGACGSLVDLLRDPRQTHRCRVREGVGREEAACLLGDFFLLRRRTGQRKRLLL